MTNLQRFLKDWLAWAEADAENESPLGVDYFRDVGLCTNAVLFAEETDIYVRVELRSALAELRGTLPEPFDPEYPFGKDQYLDRMSSDTQHLDPNRLAWVRKQLEGM